MWGGDPKCEHIYSERERPAGGGHSGESAQVGNTKADVQRVYGYKDGVCSKCGATFGQLGLEADYHMYIQHMVEVFREIKRVLKKEGSAWLNVGDSYYGGKGRSRYELPEKSGFDRPTDMPQEGMRPKCQMMIPHRVAMALIDDGWVCRNTVIWFKPSHLPSSKKDGLAPSYEFVFHFVRSDAKSDWYLIGNQPNREKEPEKHKLWLELKEIWKHGPRRESEIPKKYLPVCMNLDYYYNLDAIRIPHKTGTASEMRKASKWGAKKKLTNKPNVDDYSKVGETSAYNPLGKNPADILLASWGADKRGEYHGQATKDYESAKAQNPSDTKRRIIQSQMEHPGREKNPGDIIGYDSKYQKDEYGQTLQGFTRGNTIFEQRQKARDDAKNLFPNDPKKQQEYINFVHDHGGHPLGPNPSDVIYDGKFADNAESVNSPRARTARDGYDADEHFYHPLGANPSDFWSITTKPMKELHYAPYPEALCELPIKATCPKDGIVMDPMCGSGTTCATAKFMGRKWIGIELNGEYVSIARKRVEKAVAPLCPL